MFSLAPQVREPSIVAVVFVVLVVLCFCWGQVMFYFQYLTLIIICSFLTSSVFGYAVLQVAPAPALAGYVCLKQCPHLHLFIF